MNGMGPRARARVSSGPLASLPPVRLGDVAAAVEGAVLRGDPQTAVTEAAFDSRNVPGGALFFCVPGANADGHAFAVEAAAAGAVALVVQRWLDVDVPQLLVGSVRESMGPMSAQVFGHPAAAMRTVGVTGTNGKTTITYLLESIFTQSGLRPGVIGTTGARAAGEPIPIEQTTPEAPNLQRLLAAMRLRGVEAIAMEISSHALAQFRADGVTHDVAVFTNLSQDHLDFHGSIERYFEAKARLFTPALARRGVVNVDDAHGRLLANAPIPTTTIAVDTQADERATDIVVDRDGIAFRVGGLEVRSRLRGRFNVDNCLCAVAAARLVGCADRDIVAGIALVPGIPGRFESVDAGQDFLMLVDYAHTPDGLRNVLNASRPLSSGRVIVVLGCGGDRDRGKRPMMGATATELADLTIVTTDNPRSEDPLAIIAQIEPGAKRGGGEYIVEADRRTAIGIAVRVAAPGDVVVVAGKGHEPYQELIGGRVPFDDREVAREHLNALRESA